MDVHLKPDREAFIQRLVRAGAYATPDEVVQAAVDLLKERTHTGNLLEGRPFKGFEATGAELVTVMQSSPHKEIELEPSRSHMPVRDFSF